MSDDLDCMVLAAGHMPSALAARTGLQARGLVPVGGRPIIDRVLDAVDGAETVRDVAVVCGTGSPLLDHVGSRAVSSAGEGIVDSIRAGFAALGGPARALVVTGDLPLLTAQSVDHFCREALQSGASIVYSIINKADCERVFPGGRRTFVRLSDCVFTGGNVAVLSRQFVETQAERLTAAFAGRKNPLRLCSLLGWGFVVRLLLGKLALVDIAQRGGALLGADVHIVRSPYVEVGFDVDKPSDLDTVDEWLRSGPGGPSGS